MTPAVQYARPNSAHRVILRSCGATSSDLGVIAWGDTANITSEIPTVVPAREQWLARNPSALRAVREGLEDARLGRFESLGSFAQFADNDDE